MRRIVKYSLIGLAIVAAMVSLSYNGFVLYKGYTNTLRLEGYGQAMQMLDYGLKNEGKVVLTKTLEDGKLETIVLVPEKATK